MGLEEDIHQKKFKSEYNKAALNIMYTSNWLNSAANQFFKQYGLSQQQYNILRILRGQHPNPATVSLLMDRMLDKMSNASRLVEKLRLKNLIARKECASDRRQVDIVITEEGLSLLKKIDKEINFIDQSLHSISEKEAKELNRILDKLRG